MLFSRTKQIVINNIRKNILLIGTNKGQYDKKCVIRKNGFILLFLENMIQ